MKSKTGSTASLLNSLSTGLRRYFAVSILAAAASIVLTFLVPQVMRFTVDNVIGSETPDIPQFILVRIEALGGRDFLRANIYLIAAVIVGLAVLSGAFNYISRVNISEGTEKFTKNLRDRLFTHIVHLPFAWHNEHQTGDTIQRCISDVETVRNFVSSQLIEILRTVILVSVALWLMFSMSVKLSIISAAFIPLITLYSLLFHKRVSKQFLEADEAEGELMIKVQENLTGVRVVRAFGRERYEIDTFEEKNNLFTKKWVDLGYTLGLFWGIGDFSTGAQLLTIVCSGAFFAATGQLTLGELLVFISYTQTLAWPIRRLGRTLSELSKSGVSIARIREILDAPAEKNDPEALSPDLHADIEFKNVSFSYGEHQVLHDLSFKIEKGTTFGILGPTGSGKSTITYLLNRLYDLDEDCGSITIGGVDIKDVDRSHLRRSVGLVLQEPFLFSKTVRENIAIALDSPTMEEIRKNAETAAVDRNIMEFEDGYETVIGERGVTLSGGQKQRIALTRTLMLDSPIMVFDDSMSAVDMETDEKIRRSLLESKGSATVILISHRINTLMKADKILVIEDGRLSQIGNHRELLQEDGIYRRVYGMQSAAGMIENGGEANG